MSLLVQSGIEGTPVRSIDAAFTGLRPDFARASSGFGGQAGSNDLEVHLLGRAISVQARPSTQRTARQNAPSASLRAASGGSQRIVSPMPGKIVRVLVKAGDHVAAKQGLVVVEAMKMENELRAARAGRVRELSVAEGQSVDAGTVLLVVE
jgi:biotin carboxyl carrier protein